MAYLVHEPICRRRHRRGKIAVAVLALTLAAGTAQAAECRDGRITIAGECIGVDQAADQIRQLVSDAIGADHLQAVIASVRVGDTQVLRQAWGSSMTGVPATPEMHFRNGAVAIAYLATVLLPAPGHRT